MSTTEGAATGAPATTSAQGTEPARDRIAGIARGSRVVAAWVLVSRITGFARVAVAAAVFGPTFFGNLFQLTNSVPMLVFGLLFGPLISAIVIPPLVRHIDAGDGAAARCLANRLLGTILGVFFIVVVLGLLLAPLLLALMTATVPDAEVRREQMRLGLPLLAAILPQLLFYAVSGIAIAVQQAQGRFALAAAGPAVDNLGAIAVLAAFATLHGMGGDSQAVSERDALLLGLGTTTAVALAAAVQWWGARRTGFRLRPRAGWHNAEVRALFRTGAASIGYTGLSVATYFAVLIVASSVPGGVVVYQIANSFIQLPIALTAGALSAVQLPMLARCFHEGRIEEFAKTYRSAVRLVLFAMLPASLLLAVIPEALAHAVAFGRMAAPAGVALLAACIATRSLGAVGEAIVMLGTSASYARQDPASPLRAMALFAAVSAVGMGLAMLVQQPVAVIAVLGATATVAHGSAALYLHGRLRRRLSPAPRPDLRRSAADLGAAALAMLPAWLVVQHGWFVESGPLERMKLALLATLAAGITYLLLQFARDSRELRLLLPPLARLRSAAGMTSSRTTTATRKGDDR